MNVFATAESHMSWLGARQATVSANIANVDTPGYKAREISPFGKELQAVATRLSSTNSSHMQFAGTSFEGYTSQLQNNKLTTLSGNDVQIENEMRLAGDNTRLFSFDVGLLKSFHRMFLASVKA